MRHFCDERSGNRFIRLDAPKGLLSINYHARVQLQAVPMPLHLDEMPVSSLPDDVLHYLMPTRYCESDLLGPDAVQLFGQLPQGHSRVQAICEWVRGNIEYRIGSTNATTTAREVFMQRAGVCRDFAHLMATFARAAGIPARVVSAYAFNLQPPDFHAVAEVFLADPTVPGGGAWHLVDATGMADPADTVKIGVGRDAADVSFMTVFGEAQFEDKDVSVRKTG